MITTLRNERLLVSVDAGYGCEIVQIVDRQSCASLLFESPWREQAESIRRGERGPSSPEGSDRWLERYRGGWQTLMPSAGAERELHGVKVAYLGESSVIPWTVQSSTETEIECSVSLITVPIRVDRSIRIDGHVLSIRDVLHNLSSVDVDANYCSHPAFGADLLAGDCTIRSGCNAFYEHLRPSLRHDWPILDTGEMARDLRIVPTRSDGFFGWLTEFDARWASIRNETIGIEARLSWSSHLPHAWLWEELRSTADFPWFARARVVAIEPASSPTNSTAKQSMIAVPARQSVAIEVNLAVNQIQRCGELIQGCDEG